MKICFVIEDYYDNGGGPRILTNLSNELIKYYDISIISLKIKRNNSNYILNKQITLKLANITPHKFGITKLSGFSYLKKNISYINNFDIIIGFGIGPNILLGFLRKYIKTTVIGWEHGAYIQPTIPMKILRSVSYNKLDKLIILTHRDLENFKKINHNVIVINNFIVQENKRVMDIHKNKKWLFVGRFEKVKGIDYLCKILKLYYSTSGVLWKCKIIGYGTYKKELVKFIKINKLEQVIEIIFGTLHIQDEYRQASCLLLTSRSEGFPMTILEANSFGIPTISFDCQTGPGEMVKDGYNGFLIPQYNIKLFVDKMIELQNNEKEIEKFSKNAYHITENFLLDTIMPQWLNIFENISK